MLRAPGGAPLLFLLGVACDEWKCSNEDGVVPRLATLDGDLDRLARKDWAYLLRDLRLAMYRDSVLAVPALASLSFFPLKEVCLLLRTEGRGAFYTFRLRAR